jgi:hypothetical protein
LARSRLGRRGNCLLVYGWFTEGFGARDLKEAKVPLAEFSS